MERESVVSSNISSVGYDAGIETLEVEFKSGLVYQYLNVPDFMHQRLITAESVGKFFNAEIRNAYACVKL